MMQYRRLGASGLKVPALCLGTAGFGGDGPLFAAMGATPADAACRLVDICLEAGVNMFDSADVYSVGGAETVLGQAIKGRRDKVLISTKMSLPLRRGPNEGGASRYRLVRGVEEALQRLGTDYIDLLELHAFDAHTPLEEVLSTLDQLVRDGKLRYIGVSNYSGWQLMKSLAISDRYGWVSHVAHQVHYSLVARDYEWELMPLALDQGVGALVWSPLAWGRLTGKIRRGQPPPDGSRMKEAAEFAPPVDEELFFRVVDALDAVAKETGKSVPQIAIAWLLSRPTVSSVIIGARNEDQLRDNLGAIDLKLTDDQRRILDEASAVTPPYPYHSYRLERSFNRLNPPPV